jgi:chemotaxis protein methyltransferase CheR
LAPRPVSQDGPALTDADFHAIAALLRQIAGITLSDSKRDLVFGRLNRRLRVLGLRSFAEYRAVLDGPDGEVERGEMINALTTNLTSFFREPHHFTWLANPVLSDMIRTGGPRRLRIWSAACSTGQEPYSIAMVLYNALRNKGAWDARILATDIDTNVIETAMQGRYDPESASTIPAEFARLIDRRADGTAAMPDVLKKLITFKPLNLLNAWPMRGPFDVIFCRNVVIYFDKDVQRTLFDRMADLLAPGGILFIGHSETLLGVSDRFENLGRTTYRKLD